ncbi:MAG: RDD family protein [Deltaproteobacteria bacterium HGW-Deltaproteobacteria-24]|nr:MAG: RDD family protein [Deltaproteobacteria bacterium HGW-Deltaproteobacteria-24]
MNENPQQIDSDKLELATIGSRVKAFVIDDVLITLVFIMLYWERFSATDDMMALLTLMNEGVYQVLLLKFIYQGFFVWYYGATIGKIIVKIRVIDANSWGRVSIFSSFLRAVGRIFSEMFFYVGFLIGFFNDGRRTFHDITGKSLVVNA